MYHMLRISYDIEISHPDQHTKRRNAHNDFHLKIDKDTRDIDGYIFLLQVAQTLCRKMQIGFSLLLTTFLPPLAQTLFHSDAFQLGD